MNGKSRLLFGVLALWTSALFAQSEQHYAPDHVLMRLRAPAKGQATLSSHDWRQRLALPAAARLRNLRLTKSKGDALHLDEAIVVELQDTMSVPEALALLKRNPDVVYAEPDYIGTGAAVPNDPNYSLEWHHQKIQSEAAWSISTGNQNVIVAVLDTGINTSLAEFAGRLLPGRDYVNDDTDPSDDNGHGTQVAGVLAANANNNTLVAGMDWKCRILPMKVLDQTNSGLYSNWAAAAKDAADAGAKVILLAAGGSESDQTLTNAINDAIDRGVIFVTVTHNDGTNVVRFPGRLLQCITVGGTERNDTRASFSNYGPGIDLVAPARDIYSVYNNGALVVDFGTSFAAPQVAGVAAIVAGLKPGIAQWEMEQLLRATAQDQVGDASDTPGWDQYYGFGRLNAKFAVQMGAATSAVPNPLNVSTRGFVSTGDGVLIGGFILTGVHAKNIIVRAIGPSLANLPGALQDPTLELYNSSNQLVASNDNWHTSQASDVIATTIPPSDDRESAIVRILQPGAYTMIVRGVGNTTGIALVEAYDLQATPNSQLANISTRGFIGTGDSVLIGGFIVGASSHYVLRALGPSLSSALSGALADPTLELRDANGALVTSNDDWMTDPNKTLVQSNGLAPTNSKESATFVALTAGGYTAIVRGKNATSGIGQVEVYHVD